MTLKRYFITLRPTGPFYFGSEQNFGGGDNYFARSRQVPQQTTFLGTLRYKLLEANNLLIKKQGETLDNRAVDLIGAQSFVYEKISHAQGYGAIHYISSVSLFDGQKFYFRGHKDHGFGFKNDQKVKHDFQLEQNNGHSVLKNYDVKTFYPATWIDKDGQAKVDDEMFASKTQVGIFRTVSRYSKRKIDQQDDTSEKGFYKKTSWVMKNPRMAFSFFVDLDEAAGKKLVSFCVGANMLTPVGGERSLFQFQIVEADNYFEKWQNQAAAALNKKSAFHRVVLLSDAYLKPDHIYKHCTFAMASPVLFRFLMTKVTETRNYYALEDPKSKTRQYLKKSQLFQLMEAGTVFYISDEQLTDFERIIQEARAFRQIGYNEYILFKTDNTILYPTYKSEKNG